MRAYKYNSKRLNLLVAFVLACFIVILGRVFYCQIINPQSYVLGTSYQEPSGSSPRGRIYVSDISGEKIPIAVNITKWRLVADPSKIDNPKEVLNKLSSYLNIPSYFFDENSSKDSEENQEDMERFEEMLDGLSKKSSHYYVLKILDTQEREEIEKLDIKGIFFEKTLGRLWPEGEDFSHITGFAILDVDGIKGQYGLEKYLDSHPGKDIELTIDRTVQFFTCSFLEQAIKDYRAEGGTIIVLGKYGEILGICNSPSFNPNEYFKVEDFSVFQNMAVSGLYEPGSIFKVATMAAGLDSKRITPETTYFDKGFVAIGPEPEIIRNATKESYGTQTMTNVLEKSLNTGAVWVAQQLGKDLFKYYLKEFGFGSLTGIELPDEARGNIENLDKPGEIYLATASFGQGITATPLQVANFFLLVANRGKLYQPYIIKGNGPKFIRNVFKRKQTGEELVQMLVSVVENGYGKRAKVDGYQIAGKTGTAEVPKEEGGGYGDKVIHSFAGFAPAQDPQFVILVKLDNPQKGKFADSTAAPTFGKLAKFLLSYYHIAP